jgi:hypothetical protein
MGDGNTSKPYPLALFWHVATLPQGAWTAIVRDQARAIAASGLRADVLVVVLGDASRVRAVLAEELPCATVFDGGVRFGKFEFPTLLRLQRFCKVAPPLTRVGYMHDKGASQARRSSAFFTRWCWRKLMEHFLLTLWSSTLDAMDAAPEAAAAGTTLLSEPWTHYSGNFWWARCSHINALPRVETLDWRDRFQAEAWVGRNSEAVFRDCWKPWPRASLDLRFREFPIALLANVTRCAAPNFTAPLPPPPAELLKMLEMKRRDLSSYRPAYIPSSLNVEEKV